MRIEIEVCGYKRLQLCKTPPQVSSASHVFSHSLVEMEKYLNQKLKRSKFSE